MIMKYFIEYFLLVLLLLIQARGEQNFTAVFYNSNLTISHDMDNNVKRSQLLEHIQRKTTDEMNITAVVTKSSKNNSTEEDINHQLYPSNSVRNHRTRLQQPQSQLQSPFTEKSKWVSLAGCGFWRFQATDTLTKTEKTFRTYLQNNLLRAEDWFQCALRCSAEPDNSHFAFFKTVCMCTHNKYLVYDKDDESCFRMCDTIEQYCYSDVGLPVFVFKQSTKETKIPTQLMRYSHHCLYEENGEYKRKTKGFCIDKLSKEDCSNLNVIFSFGLPPSNLFVQWICENSTDAYTKYYRVIQNLTEYASSTEQIPTVASTEAVSESHIEQGNSSSRQDESTVHVLANTMDTGNHGIFIFNGVLLSVIIMILAAYGVLHIIHTRKQRWSATINGSPNIKEKCRISSHYDTIGVESGSDRSNCIVQITNQAYSGTDDISQ